MSSNEMVKEIDNHQAASNKTLTIRSLLVRKLPPTSRNPMPAAADHRCPMNYCNSIGGLFCRRYVYVLTIVKYYITKDSSQ